MHLCPAPPIQRSLGITSNHPQRTGNMCENKFRCGNLSRRRVTPAPPSSAPMRDREGGSNLLCVRETRLHLQLALCVAFSLTHAAVEPVLLSARHPRGSNGGTKRPRAQGLCS